MNLFCIFDCGSLGSEKGKTLHFSNSMFSDRRSTELNVKGFFVSGKTRIIATVVVIHNGSRSYNRSSSSSTYVEVIVVKVFLKHNSLSVNIYIV